MAAARTGWRKNTNTGKLEQGDRDEGENSTATREIRNNGLNHDYYNYNGDDAVWGQQKFNGWFVTVLGWWCFLGDLKETLTE
jgi:hypothetical protein